MSANPIALDCQHRWQTYSVGQHHRFKNPANLVSVIDQHAVDLRSANQVAVAVQNVCVEGRRAIVVDGKHSVNRFVGKGPTYASVLASSGIAVQVKGDYTHGRDW